MVTGVAHNFGALQQLAATSEGTILVVQIEGFDCGLDMFDRCFTYP